jgi:hypothetical protein
VKPDFIFQKNLTRDEMLARLIRFIHTLPTDKTWRVRIERYKKARSNSQNNALWGVAYKTLHQETGNDPDDMHTYFCGEFFGWVEYDLFGQRRKKPRRTTTTDENGMRDVMSTMDFMDFYAFIQQRSAETVGVDVPDPNEDFESAA